MATTASELIPGAYERRLVTPRQSGSMGGPAFGSASVAVGHGSMSAATIADREREGGGAVSQRRHPGGCPATTTQHRRGLHGHDDNGLKRV
jgi:hypothetical protein